MKRLLIISVSASLGLMGCVGYLMGYRSGTIPFEEQTFFEEVILLDGTHITVRRDVVPGEVVYTNIGYKGWASVWRITLPNGSSWQVNGVNAVAVDRDERSWIIVAVPEVNKPYRSFGCPIPPYVYYRNVGTAWNIVPPSDVPDRFSFNLLVKADPVTPQNGQFFRAAEKSRIRTELLDHERKRWAMPYMQYGGPRKLWWFSPLSYLDEFSKQCNPNIHDCDTKRDCQ